MNSELTSKELSAALTLSVLKYSKNDSVICELCDAKLTNVNNLISHCNMHFDYKPYACENCPKAYFCLGNLIRHKQLCLHIPSR